MPLTKREHEAFARLEYELAIARALRFTEPVEPDVMPPEGRYGDKGLSKGWTFNAYSQTVDVGCSSSVSHAIGRTDKTTSQRAIRLYSSKLLALKALRHEVELKCASQLAAIDRQIAAEMDGK